MAPTKGIKQKDLSPKQSLFCQLYANKDSKTFGNAVKSYIASGYKDSNSAHACSSTLLTNEKIRKEVKRLKSATTDNLIKYSEIKKEYALTKHQELYERAFDDHDNTSCVALLRMYWQAAGLLSERLVIDVQDSRKFDADYTKEAKRIASIVLETQGLPDHAPDTIGHDQLNSGFDTVSDQFLTPPPAIETPQHIVLPDVVDETISGTDFLSDD